jgi:hypothetical protein
MSELAQFVAAVTRDKAISDLLDENRRLREMLHEQNRLEIKGKSGYPIYLRTHQQFTDGTYLFDDSNNHLQLCPLKCLPELEICLGGVQMESLWDDSWGFIDGNSIVFLFEKEEDRERKFSIEITIDIEGWSEERRCSLERVDPRNVFTTLVHSFPVTNDMEVRFKNVSIKN